MNNFIILTGGPGVGKTSLLNFLNKVGFKTVPEDAREIIKEQITIHGQGLPWMDKMVFSNLMIERSISSYKSAVQLNSSNTCFFDRGILDTLAYAEMENIIYPTYWEAYAMKYRYNPLVFLLPPWKDIYLNDSQRKQSWKKSVETYNWIKTTYKKFNYQIIEVPLESIEKRTSFILEVLSQ